MTRGIVGQQECSVKQQRGKFDDCIINSVHVSLVDLFTLKKRKQYNCDHTGFFFF